MILKLLIFFFSYMIILHVLNILFPINEGFSRRFRRLRRAAKNAARSAAKSAGNIAKSVGSAIGGAVSQVAPAIICPPCPDCPKAFDQEKHIKKDDLYKQIDEVSKIQGDNLVEIDSINDRMNDVIEPFRPDGCKKCPDCPPGFNPKKHIKKNKLEEKISDLEETQESNESLLNTIINNMDDFIDSLLPDETFKLIKESFKKKKKKSKAAAASPLPGGVKPGRPKIDTASATYDTYQAIIERIKKDAESNSTDIETQKVRVDNSERNKTLSDYFNDPSEEQSDAEFLKDEYGY